MNQIAEHKTRVVFFFFFTWLLGKGQMIIHSQEKIAENHLKVFSSDKF
jgi:hypothetical protein